MMRGIGFMLLVAGIFVLTLGCGSVESSETSTMRGVSAKEERAYQEREIAYYAEARKEEMAGIEAMVLSQWFFDKKPSDDDYRRACGLLADSSAKGGWSFDWGLEPYTDSKTAKLAEAIDNATSTPRDARRFCASKGDPMKYEGFAEVQRLRAEGKLPRPR